MHRIDEKVKREHKMLVVRHKLLTLYGGKITVVFKYFQHYKTIKT